MELILIVIVSLLALGLVAWGAGWLRQRKLLRQLEAGEIEEMPAVRTIDQECCGQHEVCERDSLLAAVSKAIEYYDDEELDRYHGRESDDYTDEEADEFRDILYTMKSEDVAGWVRSLQLRAINLPMAVKDEVYMIISERRAEGMAAGYEPKVPQGEEKGNRLTSSSSKTLPLIIIMLTCLLASCSTKKNTAITRFYHRFTAKYNTTYNGELAFLEGLEAQEKGHRDDYTVLFPMYMSANQATAGMGKSNYERAIEKAEKAIKKHSIKVKPVRKGNKRLSAKEKAYRNRREFNTFLKRPWMMLGECQFRKGEFIEAASTFSYIIRLYADQPDVVCVARAWLARCYVMLEWPYDAEDVLRKMGRDSITDRGIRERDRTQAAYYVLTGQYAEAVEPLRKAVKSENRSKQKARLNYLLGQVAQLAGDQEMAYKAWRSVIRSSPPYELAFNARLRQAEVLSASNYRKVLAKLRRMARSDKNKDYQDQIYHAIGKVYLSQRDTMQCIYAFEKGVEKATQSGSAKVALMLHLGQIYWEKEEYVKAAKMYEECVSAMDKKHADYQESVRRNDILKELAPPLADVELQDSLLALSEMSEKDRNAAIDRVIAELKRKEKEEAKKLEEQGGAPGQNNVQRQGQQNKQNQMQIQAPQRPGQKGVWYFYNPQTVAQGLQQFVKQWGNRVLEDNWRRSSKQQVNADAMDAVNYDEEELARQEAMQDSLANAEEERIADSLANDPHRREYYLKQIPFEPEAKQAAHALISEGLFNAGMIEITPLENYPLAERTLSRLLSEYPEFDKTPEVYYHLFLLYGRQGFYQRQLACRDTLIERWPEHQYARLLANPRYERNAKYGKHIEDSLYATAYDHYRVAEYKEVEPLYEIHTEDFPEGPHRGRFLFVRAMSALYSGQRDTFMVTMKTLTDKYSKDSVSVWAKDIVKGVQEGRMLNADGVDMSSLWGRRNSDGLAMDSASVAADTLSADRLTGFVFVLAWPPYTLDENQLLYEMARYNFSTFMARNFEIEIRSDGPVKQMLVRGFNSFDEAHSYAQDLYLNTHMRERLEGIRTLLISEDNLARLGKRYSYDDYDDFFQKYFVPDEVPEDLKLDEPEIEVIDPENIDPNEKKEEEEEAEEEGGEEDWMP